MTVASAAFRNLMAQLPVITFVGKSNSGKTTFLEKVIAQLTNQGYRVATVKHHAHTTEVDTKQKDSWRHAQAGSVVSMVSSPSQFSVVHAVQNEVSMERIIDEAQRAQCDVLIAEGFKRLDYPKIELSRIERSDKALCSPEEVEALVTNNQKLADEFCGSVPVFGLEDIEEFCLFFVRHCIEG